MQQQDSTKRFSHTVENYINYRPDYPIQVIYYLKKILLLDSDFVVADVGAGTGKSSALFLPHVRKVYGIEPNAEMRAAAKKIFAAQHNYIALDGTAENTHLADRSVDMVIAAQAFHWFDLEKSKQEFKRILRENRPVLILWAHRDHESSNFMRAYKDFLNTYSLESKSDYDEVVRNPQLHAFFENGFESTHFPYEQTFDLKGLKGRYLSASYAFAPEHPRHQEAMQKLEELFQRYEYKGEVIFNYKIALHYGLFNKRQIVLWKKVVFHLLRIPAFFAYVFLLSLMFFSSLGKKLKKKLSGK